MVVEYIDNGKRALFDDLIFVRDDKTGYYRNSKHHLRLHRAVYEYFNGEIPEDYHVHHIDHDRSNNEPDNLIALTEHDHLKLHAAEMTEECRERRRIHVIENVVPAAKEWHASNEGHAWHLAHYEKMKDALHRRECMMCDNCGKEFEGVPSTSRFCSNNCKSAWRRKAGLDSVTKQCAVCGQDFVSNKYMHTATCSRSCARRLQALHQGEAYSKAAD